MMERSKSETVYFVDVRTTAEYTEVISRGSAGSRAGKRCSVPTKWRWSGTLQ